MRAWSTGVPDSCSSVVLYKSAHREIRNLPCNVLPASFAAPTSSSVLVSELVILGHRQGWGGNVSMGRGKTERKRDSVLKSTGREGVKLYAYV